ncbi:MAG: hypothetical protein ACRBFS_14850 [Aureispira sp.]
MTIKTNPNLLLTGLVSLGLFLGACNNNAPTPINDLHLSQTQEMPQSLPTNKGTATTSIGTATAFTAEATNTSVPSSASPLSTLAIAPPIKGVDVAYQEYSIQAGTAKEIVTPTGSRITIPANAFVDKNGTPVTGAVDIRYREFHSAEDIIASGIPMHEPETGAYMQTAGMFEIKGEQNGQEIFMTANKPVQIDMASQVAGNNYNFYQLGPKDCRWKDKGTQPAQPNTHKLASLRKLDAQLNQLNKPTFVKSTQTNNFVFDLKLDYQRQPELKTFTNVVWEYTGAGANPEENEWVFEPSTRWEGVEIEPLGNGHYDMIFKGDKKEFRTTVRPVLSDKDYDNALAAFNKRTNKAYKEAKEKQESIRQGVEAQGDLVRSFEVSDFGVYNWDIWKRDNRRRCKVAPRFDMLAQQAFEKTGSKNVQYFLVTNDNRSVVRYDNNTIEKFSYNPNEKNMLLAILPNGQAAMAKNRAFMAFDKQRNKDHWNLELETTGAILSSVDDIKRLVSTMNG